MLPPWNCVSIPTEGFINSSIIHWRRYFPIKSLNKEHRKCFLWKFEIFQHYQSDDNAAQLSDILIKLLRWKLTGQHFKFIEIELLQIAPATSLHLLTSIMTFYSTINELQSEYHHTAIMKKTQRSPDFLISVAEGRRLHLREPVFWLPCDADHPGQLRLPRHDRAHQRGGVSRD